MKFSEIQLHPLLMANIAKMQFVECTKIQEQALPWIRQGKDVAGLAQTGTGKTGAFLIPLVDRLLKSVKPDSSVAESSTSAFAEWKKRQFILVLVPTRELAEQVQEIAQKLLEGTGMDSVSVYGGTSYDKQTAALKNGVEFVIATPGRLIDLFKEHICDLGAVRAIVFDEADRMFDMGFKDDMKFILRRVPRDRQMLVFSATLNFDVLNVAYEFGADPMEINISRDQAKADNVKDQILHVGNDEKPRYLLSLLKKIEPKQAIIFSNFKNNVDRYTRFLTQNGVPAVGISSLLTQAQRTKVMGQFKADNDRNIMVATDVAARGLDILGVDLVINLELPDDPENYVHRIGRTGRAGQTGSALSLVSDRDVDALQRIEEYLKHKVEVFWPEESDLIADFKPLPPSEDRFSKRPPREGGGDRGPRRDRGGDHRGRGPGRGGEQRAAGGGGGGERHRDRQSGRHRDRPRHQQGEGQEQRRHQGGQHAAKGGGGGGGRPQGQRGGRHHDSRRPRPDGQGQTRQAGGGQQPRGQGQFQRRPLPPRKGTPAAAQAQGGLGSKVSGFFKKLFGGGS